MTKVLLIEDDGETAEEIFSELNDRGFEVEWSSDGIDGLDKARFAVLSLASTTATKDAHHKACAWLASDGRAPACGHLLAPWPRRA